MRLARAAVYRVRQFWAAVRAELGGWRPPDLSAYLDTSQQALFARMTRADQRHSVAILQALLHERSSDAVDWQAALLHDVGKAEARLQLWQRALWVLLRTTSPHLLERLAADRPGSWRYPLYLYRVHAARGAELVHAAGGSPLLVALIRLHDTPAIEISEPDLSRRLEILQRADSSQ